MHGFDVFKSFERDGGGSQKTQLFHGGHGDVRKTHRSRQHCVIREWSAPLHECEAQDTERVNDKRSDRLRVRNGASRACRRQADRREQVVCNTISI